MTLLITDHKENMKAADFWHITDDNLPFPLNQVQVLFTFFFFSISTPFFLHVIHLLEEPGYWSYRMSTFGCLRLYVSFNLVYSYKVVFTSSSLTRFRFNILGMDAVYPVPLHQKAHIWLSNFCSTVICL